MKLLILLSAVIFASCSNGCIPKNAIQKHDKRPFRVQAITPFGDNMYIVHLEGHKPLRYFKVPDSIHVGKIIML